MTGEVFKIFIHFLYIQLFFYIFSHMRFYRKKLAPHKCVALSARDESVHLRRSLPPISFISKPIFDQTFDFLIHLIKTVVVRLIRTVVDSFFLSRSVI